MHLANVDLNLLKSLEVLLDERQVSRAATRFHLSQSAMSRTLARLRETFGDELLVRTQGGYELTPRARALQDELAVLMPRLRLLVRGDSFDPASATDALRICASDYAVTVLSDHLFPAFVNRAPHMSLTVTPILPSTFADLDQGRTDLVLTPIEPPDHLNRMAIFVEDFVCMLSRSHPVTAARLSVEELAAFPQATVGGMHPQQRLVIRQLDQLGVRTATGIRVPYFSTVAAAVKGTELIAVMPRRFAWRYVSDEVRIAEAPPEIAGFSYQMIWHPRVTGDAAHRWLRTLVSEAGASLPDLDAVHDQHPG